jgi:hypothetical protein
LVESAEAADDEIESNGGSDGEKEFRSDTAFDVH